MRSKLKAGDLIILEDGNTGILIERFDIYNRPNGGDWKSCWSWRIVFTNPASWSRGRLNYNDEYGWAETNILNRCHGKILYQ